MLPSLPQVEFPTFFKRDTWRFLEEFTLSILFCCWCTCRNPGSCQIQFQMGSRFHNLIPAHLWTVCISAGPLPLLPPLEFFLFPLKFFPFSPMWACGHPCVTSWSPGQIILEAGGAGPWKSTSYRCKLHLLSPVQRQSFCSLRGGEAEEQPHTFSSLICGFVRKVLVIMHVGVCWASFLLAIRLWIITSKCSGRSGRACKGGELGLLPPANEHMGVSSAGAKGQESGHVFI